MTPLNSLRNLIQRNPAPEPWHEGDNIPWHDPDFSARMLKEHLTQAHDMASRRAEKIDQHVNWIHHEALDGQAGKLLDLGCGPGLYASRLARLGHQVTGIDYSPASIAYAREIAQEEALTCSYLHADLRAADFGHSYDAAMLIFGEFNVFRPADIRKIMRKVYAALKPGGRLILEPHTFEIVQEIGSKPPSWFAAKQGLFSPQPHLTLTENFWDADQNAATIRHFVLETETGNMIRYAQSMQAYTPEAYRTLLQKIGFEVIHFYPSLMGQPDPQQEALLAICARKTGDNK